MQRQSHLMTEQERAHVAAMRAHPEGPRPWIRARDALVMSALSAAERIQGARGSTMATCLERRNAPA
jgi:hypothetical protein